MFVPAGNGGNAVWEQPSSCRWDAPEYLTVAYPLRARYLAAFAGSDVNVDKLGLFFQRTLDIPDLSWQDIIDELSALKKSPQIKGNVVRQLYELLDDKHYVVSPDEGKIRQVKGMTSSSLTSNILAEMLSKRIH